MYFPYPSVINPICNSWTKWISRDHLYHLQMKCGNGLCMWHLLSGPTLKQLRTIQKDNPIRIIDSLEPPIQIVLMDVQSLETTRWWHLHTNYLEFISLDSPPSHPMKARYRFDIVSLFTSIQLELACEITVHLLDDLSLPSTVTI